MGPWGRVRQLHAASPPSCRYRRGSAVRTETGGWRLSPALGRRGVETRPLWRSTPDFGTGCGSSCLFVVLSSATGVCLYVLRRGVGMQLVEAALAEQLDPAHEWQQEEELPSSHSRCLITTFVRSDLAPELLRAAAQLRVSGARLRCSATRTAAPSCGSARLRQARACGVARSSAERRRSVNNESRRRWSSERMLGTGVCANHCWGTFLASRATRTHAVLEQSLPEPPQRALHRLLRFGDLGHDERVDWSVRSSGPLCQQPHCLCRHA